MRKRIVEALQQVVVVDSDADSEEDIEGKKAGADCTQTQSEQPEHLRQSEHCTSQTEAAVAEASVAFAEETSERETHEMSPPPSQIKQVEEPVLSLDEKEIPSKASLSPIHRASEGLSFTDVNGLIRLKPNSVEPDGNGEETHADYVETADDGREAQEEFWGHETILVQRHIDPQQVVQVAESRTPLRPSAPKSKSKCQNGKTYVPEWAIREVRNQIDELTFQPVISPSSSAGFVVFSSGPVYDRLFPKKIDKAKSKGKIPTPKEEAHPKKSKEEICDLLSRLTQPKRQISTEDPSPLRLREQPKKKKRKPAEVSLCATQPRIDVRKQPTPKKRQNTKIMKRHSPPRHELVPQVFQRLYPNTPPRKRSPAIPVEDW